MSSLHFTELKKKNEKKEEKEKGRKVFHVDKETNT